MHLISWAASRHLHSTSTNIVRFSGYKFDETDGSSEMLRLQYSRFPGTRPPSRDIPGPREAPQGGRGRGRGRGRDSFNSNRPFRH